VCKKVKKEMEKKLVSSTVLRTTVNTRQFISDTGI
jgi:hypothetical protein